MVIRRPRRRLHATLGGMLTLFACLVVASCGSGVTAEEPATETAAPAAAPSIDYQCPPNESQLFPPDNPWNTDISNYPVHPNSDNFIGSIGADKGLHEDFGTMWEGRPSGIPYCIVSGDAPKVPVTFEYADESDPGPYPIPENPPIEGGPDSDGDRHILMLDEGNGILYELWHAYLREDGWHAGSGAIFNLNSNDLRPLGWTSSDAAGLPVLPGLVRYDEVVEKGEINHAIRFTVTRTQRGYILPATHFASPSADPILMPMGLRLRLRADYDISNFPPDAQVILRAFKRYGIILADNGGDWFISGTPDPRWNQDTLSTIRRVTGGDFEVVVTGEIIH